MPQIDSWPPFSSFELERQAAIERNLFIQDCGRAAMRWLRLLALRGTRFARRVAAERQRRKAIRQLKGLDDRTLRDIGVHRGEIEFVVRNGVPARERRALRQERRNIAPPRRRAA
jgi:uncharacterized protein YjiS (DUF1127 family)